MRNYIQELKQSGLSYKAIAAETGINARKVSAIARGQAKIKSSSNDYSAIRNLSRRQAYKLLRESDFTPEAAHQYQRIGLSEKTYYHKRIREVTKGDKVTSLQGEMQQLKILGEFKRGDVVKQKDGVSFARRHISPDDVAEISIENLEDDMNNIESIEDYPESSKMLQEAINSARAKLGSSGWELIRLIDIEVITYRIK